MQKNNFLTVQSFWMFVTGVVVGILVILAVFLAQGVKDAGEGQTDLLRGEYGEAIYYDRFSGSHVDRYGTVIPNFDPRNTNGGLESSFYKDPSSSSYRDAHGTVIPNFYPNTVRGYDYSYKFDRARGAYTDAYGTVIPNFYPSR